MRIKETCNCSEDIAKLQIRHEQHIRIPTLPDEVSKPIQSTKHIHLYDAVNQIIRYLKSHE